MNHGIGSWTWAGLAVAVVLAGLYSWLELSETTVSGEMKKRLRRIGAEPVMPRFLSPRLAHLVLFRVAIDGVFGAAAFIAVTYPALRFPHNVAAIIAGFLAGLIGPGVARSQTLGPIDIRVDVNARYRKLVSRIDRRLGNKSASEQARWLDEKALPVLGQSTVDELLVLLCSYADSLGQQQVLLKAAEFKTQLTATAKDDATPAPEVKRALLQQTLDAGGLTYLRRETKKRARAAKH